MNKGVLLSVVLINAFLQASLFAQETGKTEKIEKEIEREKLLRQRIERKKEEPKIEERLPTEAAPALAEEKIFIRKINVSGVTLVQIEKVSKITLTYENKELSLKEIQKIADLITDIYRQKGYVTSRAYLPPQKIVGGVLEIRVVEGITGDIQIKGNRYFKTRLIRDKIILEKDGPFNYDVLRKGLSKINQQPDRKAKAVLVPGKETGTTDIILDVKDRLPIHIGFDWDNFGSRFIDQDRFRTTLTHNNLLGADDILTFQYQLSEGENYRLISLRYLFPIKEDLKLGFLTARSKLKLGRDFEDLNARGKSSLYSIYATRYLIDKENLGFSFNLAFDYKDVFNFQADEETSRDRLRVIRGGFDLDFTDNFGRTLVSNEMDFGIPGIMGGLKKQDNRASRSGSGGKFFKDYLNLLRLHRLSHGATLLWKNQLQYTPYILPAAEQFQIGGVANVRGYPPAELVGDKGYAWTLELSVPPYLVSRNIRVPFSKAKVFDALRIVTFYDWANTRLRRPQAGEQKNRTLRGAGWGVRFNLPEDFSARIEFAWPLDNTPSDGKHLHTWTEITKKF